ncbi:MAG: protein-disulfide reductase DsbD [bacterium]
MSLRRFALTLWLLLLPAAAAAQGSQPFEVSAELVQQDGKTAVRVTYRVPDGHFIYRDMSSVEVRTPDGVEAGEVLFPPGQMEFDQFSGKEKEIFPEDFHVTVPLSGEGSGTVEVTAAWQGCDDSVCFFPAEETFRLSLGDVPAPGSGAAESGSDPRPAPGEGLQDFSGPRSGASTEEGLLDFDLASRRGSLWMYLAAFIGGILTSLTPCVLPIIPLTITVIGARGAESRAKSFGLSLIYVLGIALTYSILGVVAASTGALFGSLFQSTWFLVFAIALFTLLAFGLFGAYELQLPAPVRNRLMAKQGKGFGGVFFMGLIAGLVASPCVGPVLVGVLAFIATTGSVMFGFTLLFTFAMGMGILFLVVGTFSGEIQRLPSGPWMSAIEYALGALMLGVAFYYLHILVDPFTFAVVLGTALVSGGVFSGAFHTVPPEGAGWELKSRKALGILMVAAGLYFFVGGLMTRGVFLPALSGTVGTTAGPSALSPGLGERSQAAGAEWGEDLEAALQTAEREEKPVVVDFTADWCVACKELDHFTFSDPRVVEAFRDFILVRVDMTDDTSPKNREYQREYEIYGLPSVTFLTPAGEKMDDLTVTGFMKAPRFLEILEEARSRSGTSGM